MHCFRTSKHSLWHSNTAFCITLTFDFQVYMILRNAKGVGGDAGVFAVVEGLRHRNLQSPVLMKQKWISYQNAGAAVLKPAEKNPNKNPSVSCGAALPRLDVRKCVLIH